jgi:hypothetical protein
MNENGKFLESYRQKFNLRTLKNTCAGVTLTTTHPTWSRLELSVAFRADSQKPANIDLSDATHPPNISKGVSRLFNKFEGRVRNCCSIHAA